MAQEPNEILKGPGKRAMNGSLFHGKTVSFKVNLGPAHGIQTVRVRIDKVEPDGARKNWQLDGCIIGYNRLPDLDTRTPFTAYYSTPINTGTMTLSPP